MGPKLEQRVNELPVSPLCDIEVPLYKWEPGNVGGDRRSDGGNKFILYIESKKPGLPPAGWRDITPYFGKVWPKSLSGWRTCAAKQGYYISVTTITKTHPETREPFTYRVILVCLKPVNGP